MFSNSSCVWTLGPQEQGATTESCSPFGRWHLDRGRGLLTVEWSDLVLLSTLLPWLLAVQPAEAPFCNHHFSAMVDYIPSTNKSKIENSSLKLLFVRYLTTKVRKAAKTPDYNENFTKIYKVDNNEIITDSWGTIAKKGWTTCLGHKPSDWYKLVSYNH